MDQAERRFAIRIEAASIGLGGALFYARFVPETLRYPDPPDADPATQVDPLHGTGLGISDAIAARYELSQLSKAYGSRRGLAGLTLTVEVGEVFGFLGPNGAGKTTTIRLLLDLIRPTSGADQESVEGQPGS